MLSPAIGPWFMRLGMNTLWLACALLGVGTALVHLVFTTRLLPAGGKP
jgi:hypothetical protein